MQKIDVYKRQLWYRAQVLSVIRDAANILFVDYGNQETVEFVKVFM